MKKINKCYTEYLQRPPKGLRFVIVDPPWKYDTDGSKLRDMTAAVTGFQYWGKDNRKELENLLGKLPGSVDAAFVWTTNPMLEATMKAIFQSSVFGFRSLITWEKTTTTGKQAKVMAHYFMNCTEFLIFIVRKKTNRPIPRAKLPTHIRCERGGKTVKPKGFERELVERIGGKWAYIFSGPEVEPFKGLDIDLVDLIHT